LRIYHARTRLRAELQKIWRCGPLSPHIGSGPTSGLRVLNRTKEI
jgi:hypothetical protein